MSECGISFLLHGASKSGKGLPYSTPTLTPTGWQDFGSLSIGDEVIGSDGHPTIVLAIFERGPQECYRIEFDDGESIITDSSHLWRTRRRNTDRWAILSTEDIYRQIGVSTGPVGEPLYIPTVAWQGIKSDNPLPVEPYLLGLMLGDGSFRSSTPRLTCADPEICIEAPEGTTVRHTGIEFFFVNKKNEKNPLTEALRSLDLWGLYSHEKFIPKIYLKAPIADRVALLQGIMDSDGFNDGKMLNFVTTSLQLCKDFRELIWSVGGCTKKITDRSPTYTYKKERKMGKRAYRTALRLPIDMVAFRGSRRHYYEDRNRIRHPLRRIASVAPSAQQPTRCIAVANFDGLFVVDKFIVTHNTTLADSAPGPRLLLDSEGNSRFLKSKKISWVPTVPPPEYDGSWETCVTYVRDFSSLSQAYAWLAAGKHSFRSVIIDSISEAQQRCIDAIAGDEQLKLQQWGEVYRKVAQLVRQYRDLLTHPTVPLDAVILTAMTKQNQDGKWYPYVQGQLATALPYYIDTIGFLKAQISDEGEFTNFLLTKPHAQYEAGDRSGVFPTIITNPRLDDMVNMICNPEQESR